MLLFVMRVNIYKVHYGVRKIMFQFKKYNNNNNNNNDEQSEKIQKKSNNNQSKYNTHYQVKNFVI